MVCIATSSKVYNRFHVTAVFPLGQYDLWDKDQGRSFYLGNQHSAIYLGRFSEICLKHLHGRVEEWRKSQDLLPGGRLLILAHSGLLLLPHGSVHCVTEAVPPPHL